MKKGKMMENEKRCVNCEYRYEEDGNLIFTSEECNQCAGFITGYRNFNERVKDEEKRRIQQSKSDLGD